MSVRRGFIALAIAACILISGCVPTSEQPGPPAAPGVNSDGTSRLDATGLAQIEEGLEIRFDVSNGQLLRSDVGLGEEDHVPDVAPGELMTLRIEGPSGTLEARTDHVRFRSDRGEPQIRWITYFLTAQSGEELVEIVRAGVDEFQFENTGESLERRLQSILDDPAEERRFTTKMGYATGFGVSYDVEYLGEGHVNVIIVTAMPGVASLEDLDP